jgi:hypothetical protein
MRCPVVGSPNEGLSAMVALKVCPLLLKRLTRP